MKLQGLPQALAHVYRHFYYDSAMAAKGIIIAAEPD
jgi:hypothetical protein